MRQNVIVLWLFQPRRAGFAAAPGHVMAVCQLALLLPEKWIRPVKNTMEVEVHDGICG